MGELHHFLDVKVIQNPQIGEVWIGQEAYAQRVLQNSGMPNAKPIKTPVDTSSKLVKMTVACVANVPMRVLCVVYERRFWSRKNWAKAKKRKEQGGGGAVRECLQANPTILKTCSSMNRASD